MSGNQNRARSRRKQKSSMNIIKRNLFRSRWMKAVGVLASLVVFITVYMLILPAATITPEDATPEGGFYLTSADAGGENNVTVNTDTPALSDSGNSAQVSNDTGASGGSAGDTGSGEGTSDESVSGGTSGGTSGEGVSGGIGREIYWIVGSMLAAFGSVLLVRKYRV